MYFCHIKSIKSCCHLRKCENVYGEMKTLARYATSSYLYVFWLFSQCLFQAITFPDFLIPLPLLVNPLHPAAAAGAPGVSGVPSRAQFENDCGKEASSIPCRGVQWGGSPQGSQIPVWAPQSFGWEGGSVQQWNMFDFILSSSKLSRLTLLSLLLSLKLVVKMLWRTMT